MTALNTLTAREIESYYPREEASGFGALSTDRGVLPLKAMDVRTRIDGLIAATELRQTFVNTLGVPLEATYIFPMPDRAAVTRFRMEVAGRVIEGVIKERGQARADYDQAIAQGKRAAITEEERSGVFTMRVGNIMPHETATVTLNLVGPLPYDEGEATFRFPLVVPPRYIPGAALGGDDVGDGTARDTDAVPDASRITPPVLLPGYPNPVRLAIEVEIGGNLPIGEIRSSLHAVMEDYAGRGVRRIRLLPGERLDRDFILRFKLGGQGISSSLELREDVAGSGEGTFVLSLLPPIGLSASKKPRDVIFILDRSGSMEGWKMIAARRAVARMVDSLAQADNFNVFAFDDNIEVLHGSGMALVQATNRNRFQAIEFLANIASRGGTEMRQPLEIAADKLAGGYADREKVIVLVTDGQVGNEDQILRSLGARLKNVKVFALGIDRAVNEAFLHRLAEIGGGLSEIVESEDRLDEVMDRMHRRIGTPVVTECNLFPSGLEALADTIVPRRLPDLYAGAPIMISGRYRGAPRGSLEVRGRDASGAPWSCLVHAQPSANPAITAIWARGQVREQEDRFVVSGGSHGMEQEIIRTSLRFGVLCRFTAFVAVDQERVNASGQVHRVIQAVEAADGWAMLGKGGVMPASPVYAKTSSAGAVPAGRAASYEVEELSDWEGAAPEVTSNLRAADAIEEDRSQIISPKRMMSPPPAARRPAPAQAAPVDLSRRELKKERAKDKASFVVGNTAQGHAARLLLWLEGQLAAGPGSWPSELPRLLPELESLARELDRDAGGFDLFVRVQALLNELKGLSGARFDERVVADFYERLREVLEAIAPEAPRPSGGGRRSTSFWKG